MRNAVMVCPLPGGCFHRLRPVTSSRAILHASVFSPPVVDNIMTESVSTQELAQFVPLNSLGSDNLKEIAAKSRRVRVPKGKMLFRQGDASDEQWFILGGTVELADRGGKPRRIEGGTDSARNGIDVGRPATCAAIAASEVTAIAVDRNLLDLMLTWDQTGSYSVEELGGGGIEVEDEEGDWMTRMLQTEAFRRIPPANIQAIFMRMEPVSFQAGEPVIEQGDTGDYFYIIRDGRCVVTRKTKTKPDGVRLAELGAGDSFGEEALISSKERNATVTMVEPGTLMRLSQEDFNELLKEPLQQWIAFEDAVKRVAAGATWLDVRLPAEFENHHIRGAINLPLLFLRMKAHQLDAGTEYIVYCDTSRRSSAASYLLNERGLNTMVLKGGMEQVPREALESGKG